MQHDDNRLISGREGLCTNTVSDTREEVHDFPFRDPLGVDWSYISISIGRKANKRVVDVVYFRCIFYMKEAAGASRRIIRDYVPTLYKPSP